MSELADTHSETVAESFGEVARLRSEVAALSQLLEVYEQAALEQNERLEQSLREREALLEAEHEARRHAEAAQAALRQRETELRTLADSIPQLAWMTDATGYIHWYNRRWYEYTGTTLEEMRGWGWQRVQHPDYVDRVRERFAAAIAAGEPWEDTFPLRGRDGEYRWFLSRALPIRDADGRIVRWFGTNTDITEQRETAAQRDRALADAKRERERLYEVFMQAPAAIAVLEGPQHVFTVSNPRYRELVGGRDIVGKPLVEALPEIRGQGFVEILDGVRSSGEPFVASEALVRLDRDADGVLEDIYVDFVYQPLKDADGRVFGIMAHAVETTEAVTARQRIEAKAEELAHLTQALERSNRELDQFAYVASHDLKAPLRGIANLAQWIQEDIGDRLTPESLEHMRLLQGRVHRMESLIDGILAYSRAGRVRAKPEAVDTDRLVHEVIELLAPPANAQIEVQPGMPLVEAERVPLQQVFMNLIANALKFTAAHRSDPVVRVGWRAVDGFYEFTISDNGPGIAPEYHERIWGIFQTLQARDKVEGTGIGLSVVKKIIETRGGQAWVESTPGEGATFHFTWPRTLHQGA